MRILVFIYILAITLISCIEEFDLELDHEEPKLVVEGLISTKPGPYLVRLTESRAGALSKPRNDEFDYHDNEIPVLGAIIIMSDNFGQVDTLIPNIINKEEYLKQPNGDAWEFKFDSDGNIVDTLCFTEAKRGYYTTTSIKGIPNRLYHLKVIANNQVFEAYDFMMDVPEIDSIKFVKLNGSAGKDDNLKPLVYFNDPVYVSNYYYFFEGRYHNEFYEYSINQNSWPGTLLSDEYLSEYVNGIEIRQGVHPVNGEVYFDLRDTLFIQLHSLSENCYNYYKNLTEQIQPDGGMFKPTPASPPNNISNGALGYFRASAISYGYGVYKN